MIGTTILSAEWVWDGIKDKAILEGAILIEEERIKAIGTHSELSRYPHDQELDFPGGTLMPGLIDCHTHLSMDPELENYLEHMSDPVAVLTLRATRMMRKDLYSGVTFCRCCGDREYLDIACRDAVLQGEVEGPHLLVAGKGIRAPHGHGFVGYPLKGINSIRKAIGENIAAGADFIKIYITGTLRGKTDLPSYLSREEIQVAIEEAHQAGLPVAAHCVGGIGMDWAVDLGLDSVEHGYHISDPQIDKLAEIKTWLVLTPSPIFMEERVNHLPAALIPGHINERNLIAERMAAVIASGIPFAVGTDGMHGGLPREISYLVELGASPAQALQAATINGARVCGIDQRTGSLKPGNDADIIAVSGNPLEDHLSLNRIIGVWKSGNRVF
jgi:imidazolonepropionase-like amidohydrolase